MLKASPKRTGFVEVVTLPERLPLGTRVDADVIDNFRDFVREYTGQVNGEMGRHIEKAMQEYMQKDRYLKIQHQLEQVEEQQQEILQALTEETSDRADQSDSTHAHTEHTWLNDIKSVTRSNLQKTIEDLSKGEITETRFENAVRRAGVTDHRTINKYQAILEANGVLLSHPLGNESDAEWIHGITHFALVCENSPSITEERLETLLGTLEEKGVFSEPEYRTALPSDFAESNELKIDNIGEDRQILDAE